MPSQAACQDETAKLQRWPQKGPESRGLMMMLLLLMLLLMMVYQEFHSHHGLRTVVVVLVEVDVYRVGTARTISHTHFDHCEWSEGKGVGNALTDESVDCEMLIGYGKGKVWMSEGSARCVSLQ